MIREIEAKLLSSRYIRDEMRKTNKMKPGIGRKLFRMGGCVKVLIQHRFNLWAYQREIDLIKNNNFIYSFERYGKIISMYLPHYEVDYIQQFIAKWADFYEAEDLEYLRNVYLRDGNVILDIGANIGNHTVFFSKICNAERVYAFEPISETYSTLCRNLALNHIEDTVVVYNVALGNTSGKAKIKCFDPYNIGAAQVEEAHDGSISMKRLDDYKFERIDFIKIDVEGFEYDLLKGAKNTLSKFSPVIYIEIFEGNFSKVDKLLRSYGYTANAHPIGYCNYIYSKSVAVE